MDCKRNLRERQRKTLLKVDRIDCFQLFTMTERRSLELCGGGLSPAFDSQMAIGVGRVVLVGQRDTTTAAAELRR